MFQKKYTTSLSVEEAGESIRQLINATANESLSSASYSGAITGNQFWLAGGYHSPMNFLIPQIKGVIRSENATVVETQFVIPPFLIFCFLLLPAVFILQLIFITRERTSAEVIGSGLFCMVAPLIIFFTNIIAPTKKSGTAS